MCRWAVAFLLVCLWPRQISGRRVACPPARRPRCELRSARRLEARPGPAGSAAASNRAGLGALALALPPPTGAAAWPHRPRGGLQSVGVSVLALALPPPTAAAARPSCALRRPPYRRCLVADVWFGASDRRPARPRHSPRASQISRVKPPSPLLARARVGLKPASPLLAQAQPQLKPTSPLRVRNGRFGCVFRLQR